MKQVEISTLLELEEGEEVINVQLMRPEYSDGSMVITTNKRVLWVNEFDDLDVDDEDTEPDPAQEERLSMVEELEFKKIEGDWSGQNMLDASQFHVCFNCGARYNKAEHGRCPTCQSQRMI